MNVGHVGALANADTAALAYFDQFYLALQDLGGPATPYDIFALHPYPSYEYANVNTGLLLDPYEHWLAEDNTILTKFQRGMQGVNALGRNDSDKEIWITEFGWNSAKGSPADMDNRCITVEGPWVTNLTQAVYLANGFDVLFTDTQWPNEVVARAAVTKVFWYQYRDTSLGINQSDCTPGQPSPPILSPSWWDSWLRRIFGPPTPASPEQQIIIPWSFGLYDGNFSPKLAHCTFKLYPFANDCYQFDHRSYLPDIDSEPSAAIAGEE